MRRLYFVSLIVVSLIVLLAGHAARPAAASPALGFTPTPAPTATDTPLPPTATPEPPDKPGPTLVDPVITKVVNVQLAQVGDVVVFTITAFNPNAVEVRNVVVVDPLPREVDYLGATTTQGPFFYDAGAHSVTFDLGTLAAGQTATLVIETRVNALGQPQTELRNTAVLWVSGSQRGASNTVVVQIIPAQIPETGITPDSSRSLTLPLAVLAALLPLAGFWLWRGLTWVYRG